RPVATYSGGQAQRVGLGMALMHRPELLVLDEPTVGLDPRIRRTLWGQFHRWAEEGTTLVVSTHVMDEANRSHRIGFINNGALVTAGALYVLRIESDTHNRQAATLPLDCSLAQV